MNTKKKYKYIVEEPLIQQFKNKSLSLENLIKLISEEYQCFKKIKIDSKQGEVFKACSTIETENCKKCKNKIAVKIFNKASAGIQELNILLQVKNSIQTDPLSVYFKHHLLIFKEILQENDKIVLVSEFVESDKNNNNLNLKQFILSGRCSKNDLFSLIIEVLFTLQYLHIKIPQFSHNDLLCQNVFLTYKIFNKFPFKNTQHMIVKQKHFSAVIGDFGLASSKQFKLSSSHELGIGADIFRFLKDASDLCRGQTDLEQLMRIVTDYAFSGNFKYLESKSKNAFLPKGFEQYLPKNVEFLLKIPKFMERVTLEKII